ncbi:hypothetical protein QL285_009579 [Trifolium repens]|nr:hypothetical protein QL285_009579 [Trifolium repens]
MTHTNSNGEWINDASKEVHTKVQERCSELLELGYMDEDKDKLTNTAFEAVVGVRSGYSRGAFGLSVSNGVLCFATFYLGVNF